MKMNDGSQALNWTTTKQWKSTGVLANLVLLVSCSFNLACGSFPTGF